jgi:hypothetical protein
MDRSAKIVVLGGLLGVWSLPATGVAASEHGAAAPVKENAGLESGAEAAPSSSRVTNLVVWVEPGVSDGERIGGWVEERGAVVLREHQPPLEPEDLVRVAVRGGPYDYQIHIALLRRKRLLEDQLDVIVCECSSNEMLDRVGEAIDVGARRLTDAATRERAEAVVQPPEPAKEAPGEDTKEDRERLGAMGYVGIGVGVLGAGVMASGILLTLRRDELRGEPGTLSRYSTRPPGIGLAVGGGVALAAGVALIVVDVVRHRKSRVAFAPAVGRGQAGLSIVGRF